MQPLPPPGRPDPRTQALFKRNALQLGPLPNELEPSESVELLHRPPPLPNNRHLAEAEAVERERNKKVYRRPTYPHPPTPPPRGPAAPGGWMLSKPSAQPKSREMREDELAIYSRHLQDPVLIEEEPPEHQSSDDTETLDPQLARWVNALLIDPPGTPGRAQLALLLAPFGLGILRLCHQQGLRVCMAEMTAFAEKENRVYAVPSEESAFLLAFALAYDLALGKGQAASADSLAVLTHFQIARTADPHLQSPTNFFAQAVAGYLQGQSGAAMHSYVDYLIQQSRGCAE